MKITVVDNNNECNCVSKHVPLPHRLYLVEHNGGSMYLCPTSFLNLSTLAEIYDEWNDAPPASLMKHFSSYIRDAYLKLIA